MHDRKLNDATETEWDSLILHDFDKDADSIFNGRHKPVAKSAKDYKPQLKSWGIDCPTKVVSDGSSTSFYELPKDAVELADLIEHNSHYLSFLDIGY